MNCEVKIKKINFTIEDELTTCDVYFESDDVVLTGTHRKKVFPASVSCVDIMSNHFTDWLLWDR